MECKYCNKEIPSTSNFCCYCSKKVVDVCNCWIKKEPYDCGQDKCPGYGLYKLLSDAKKLCEQGASEA